MAEHSIDVTDADFQTAVIQASHQVPVVLDCWAPWCGPCRALKPVLEKLAAEFQGKFILAKLNTDDNPRTSAALGIRSIPAVKAFRNGAMVAEFMGAVPESQVRAFLQKVLPTPAEQLRDQGRSALDEGDFASAESRLREAVKLDPGFEAARLDLVELLIARQAWSEAEMLLAEIPEALRDDRAKQLTARIVYWKKSQSMPSATELAASLERAPSDLELRLKLAERHVTDGDFEPALDQLLEVIRADRGGLREAARKAMLDVFRLADDERELVSRYRRLLASALN